MQIDNTEQRDWGSPYAPVKLVSLHPPDQIPMLCHGLLSLSHPWFGSRANRCGILRTHSQKTCPHCWSSPSLRTKVRLDLLTPPQRKMRRYHNKYHNWMKTCRGIDIRRSKLHQFGKEFKNIHSPPPISRLQEAERRCYELKKEMELLKGEIQHLKNSKETGKGSVPFFLIFIIILFIIINNGWRS